MVHPNFEVDISEDTLCKIYEIKYYHNFYF